MHTHRFIARVLISGLLLGAFGAGLGAEEDKAQVLNLALMDMQATEQLMRQRSALAENVRQRLLQQADDLKAEINQERRHVLATTFPQAMQISRIGYDLRLIQQLFGYTDRLKIRIGYFNSALYSLDFYRRQIHDDMLYLQTLNDADTAGLIRQLTADLNSFKAEAEKPFLSSSASGLRPLDMIWSDILQGK